MPPYKNVSDLVVTQAPPKMVKTMSRWIVGVTFADTLFRTEKEIRRLYIQTKQGTGSKAIRQRILTLGEQRKALQKYVKTPVEWKGTVSKKFDIELDGWEHGDIVTKDVLEKSHFTWIETFYLLKKGLPHSVKCNSDWVPHLRRMMVICRIGYDYSIDDLKTQITRHVEEQLKVMCKDLIVECLPALSKVNPEAKENGT